MSEPPESSNDPFETSIAPAVWLFLAGVAVIAASVGAFLVFVGNPEVKQRAPSEESTPRGTYQVQTCSIDMLQLCVNSTPAPGDRLFTPEPPVTGASWFDCRKLGKRVCLVPIGHVEPGLVERMLRFYQEEYGLTVLQGPTVSVPSSLARSITRESPDSAGPQLDAENLAFYLSILQREAGTWNQTLDRLTLIGLTSSDIYLASQPRFDFVFGQRFDYPVVGGVLVHVGIISSYRMDDRNYGLQGSQARLTSRVEKIVSKYVGLYYYELPLSHDPSSAMYDAIGRLADLDRMSSHLPLDQR